MKTVENIDSKIKADVLSELKYQPSVKASDIGVLVHEGAVTLNGFVGSYGEKWDAVNATKRVRGVSAIADDIKVKFTYSLDRTDSDIAADAANQIKWNTTIPAGTVQVTVREGWITLEGVVEWRYQYIAAQDAMQHSPGVKGVTNLITINPKLTPVNIETSIKAARTKCPVECKKYSSGGIRGQGDTPRHGSLLYRTRGSRTSSMGCAGSIFGRQST
jgi:osmotically-inducible protein OsmY